MLFRKLRKSISPGSALNAPNAEPPGAQRCFRAGQPGRQTHAQPGNFGTEQRSLESYRTAKHRLQTGYQASSILVCGENVGVDLARLGWFVTVLACLVAALILLLEGYFGYAGVTFAVAASAAINLM